MFVGFPIVNKMISLNIFIKWTNSFQTILEVFFFPSYIISFFKKTKPPIDNIKAANLIVWLKSGKRKEGPRSSSNSLPTFSSASSQAP